MSKIPLPERGQPLDVQYMYQLADAVNTISDQVSASTYKYATVDTANAGKQSVKTSELRVIGGYVDVATNTTVTVSQEISFSYSFQSDYKYAPIVTATPINIGNTPSGVDVRVTINSVTTSNVTGVVKFGTGGQASVGVNLVIVGIPN
jgi:hypothetical protein